MDMKIIFKYSDINKNANNPLAYSVLNPDTSSLSPSAKSNGVRLVSAKIITNQMKDKGGIINSRLIGLFVNIFCVFIFIINISIAINTRAIVTS